MPMGTDRRHIRAWLADGAAILGLGLLVLLAFWPIGPAGRVIAGGDLFLYFYPYWAEAARALQAGRLPLWNPYLFMGVPFLANSQAGVLYPLNWPFWLLFPPHRALHWSVLLHLWLAGSGAYLYARASLRLGHLGAWTAGAALALGGYLGVQIEHINQLQALSWLPWALLLYDRTVEDSKTTKTQRHKASFIGHPVIAHSVIGHSVIDHSILSFVSSCLWGKHLYGLAVVIGLMLLAGHTQSAFIALFGLGAVALIPRADVPLGRRLGLMAGATALGVALAAAQLLPTLELARHSVRSGGLPFNERVSFSLSPLYLARALLPTYGQAVAPEHLEYVATLGVTGLLLALHASRFTFHSSRLTFHVSRFPPPLLLSLLGLFLALGLYNPLYLLLARFVPGFAHFRAPARWLALWAVGAALLAGAGIEKIRDQSQDKSYATPGRRIYPGILALAGLFLWGALGGRADRLTVALWLAAGALGGALLALGRRFPRPAALGLTALLVAELLLSARALPHARATAPEAYTCLLYTSPSPRD